MRTLKDFCEATGMDKSPASLIRSGKRQPSLKSALDIWVKTGEKYGAIEAMTGDEIGYINRLLAGKL